MRHSLNLKRCIGQRSNALANLNRSCGWILPEKNWDCLL